ncbi:MAG: hypothetical protein ACN4GZ_01110 [Acidimicrobiales bacterium]
MVAEQLDPDLKASLHDGFPWYDSDWLAAYVAAKQILRRTNPQKLAEFEEAMAVLQIDPSFTPTLIDPLYDEATLHFIRTAIDHYRADLLETHELSGFGRHVVHDHPVFLKLQAEVLAQVEQIVDEPLSLSYNFLSLYRNSARCPVHMDAPEAKWTLDICIDQSAEWPIYFSDVQPWPEDWQPPQKGDWQQDIISRHEFTPHTMTPGQALIFGGSSQWHYRDPMPQVTDEDFCTLLFFHFVPREAADYIDVQNWPAYFGVPELAALL